MRSTVRTLDNGFTAGVVVGARARGAGIGFIRRGGAHRVQVSAPAGAMVEIGHGWWYRYNWKRRQARSGEMLLGVAQPKHNSSEFRFRGLHNNWNSSTGVRAIPGQAATVHSRRWASFHPGILPVCLRPVTLLTRRATLAVGPFNKPIFTRRIPPNHRILGPGTRYVLRDWITTMIERRVLCQGGRFKVPGSGFAHALHSRP